MTGWVMSRVVWGFAALAVWDLCKRYASKRRDAEAYKKKAEAYEMEAQARAKMCHVMALRIKMLEDSRSAKLAQVERLLDQERQYAAKLKADADRAARSWCRMYYGAGPADCELCLHREADGSCEYRVGRLRNG